MPDSVHHLPRCQLAGEAKFIYDDWAAVVLPPGDCWVYAKTTAGPTGWIYVSPK